MAYFGCIKKGSPPTPPEEVYYANFIARGYITLPFTLKSSHKITIDYMAGTYKNSMPIFGNNKPSYSQRVANFVIANNQYYVGTGTQEAGFAGDLVNRHTFIYNENGTCLFDGVTVLSSMATKTENYNYQIGARYNIERTYYNGRIYNFKIEDTENDTVICDLQPMKYNDELVFRDIINEVNYNCTGMTIEKEV